MKSQKTTKILTTVITLILLIESRSWANINLIAQGQISGDAIDNSGLSGALKDGTAHNLFGGFGSAISYTGKNNRFIAVSDRGPADGSTHYYNRIHELDLVINNDQITPRLISTKLLLNNLKQHFTGSSAAFDKNESSKNLRLDSEGIRVSPDGNIFISDEYGPYIYEFDRQTAELIRSINVPEKFLIENPDADGKKELPPANLKGRQFNRGMEGIAITPNGKKLYTIMQSPLIQDNGLNAENKRVGLNIRILEVDLENLSTKEYVYQLDSPKNGVNEILSINDQEFLVIERDGDAGNDAKTKKIFKIKITDATDVSQIASLSVDKLDKDIKPVRKSLFIDLLDPQFNLAGANFPEKIEGLAFGPDLADGRHVLIVTNDNDFNTNVPNYFYAFAIDKNALPNFLAQSIKLPEPITLISSTIGILTFGFLNRKNNLPAPK